MAERTELQRKILVIASDYPELSQAEIAERVGCSASYVSSVLNEYDSYGAMEARIEQLGGTSGFDVAADGFSESGQGFEEVDLEEVPPAGFAVTGIIIAAVLLMSEGLMTGQPALRWGIVLMGVALPVGVSAVLYRKCSNEGISAGIDWLIGRDATNSITASDDSSEKTPPAPQSLKDDLYFERADKHCEWCDTQVDSPDVHHITPRSEGGPNEPENLVVLCPNCHRKADRGLISRSKLQRVISD